MAFSGSVPFAFTAGTVAESAKVNSNFNYLANNIQNRFMYRTGSITPGRGAGSWTLSTPLVGSVVLNGSSVFAVDFQATGFENNNGTQDFFVARLLVDGAETTPVTRTCAAYGGGAQDSSPMPTLSFSWLGSLAAGSHNFAVQATKVSSETRKWGLSYLRGIEYQTC